MNNIFTEMIIPQLGDATFQTDFTAFCNAMKQNIERLISVQYTKGEPGNSVYTTLVHAGYSESNDLTNISACILNTIFNTDVFTTDSSPLDVNNILEGTGANIMVDHDYFTSGGIAPSIVVDGVEYKVAPAFMNNFEGIDISINVDDVTGVAYLASPYIFIDNRIAGLNNMVRYHSKDIEIYKTFHDFSVAIYGEGRYDNDPTLGQDPNNPATWTWEFEAVQIVPKLYFDDNINEFCWDVNGQQTGITAQGIKGDDGASPNVIIAIGSRPEASSTIYIDKIEIINESGEIEWATRNTDGTWITNGGVELESSKLPKDNDLVLAFYSPTHTSEGDLYENAFLGKVYIDGTGRAYTYVGFDEDGRCDIFESIRLHDHWRLMMTINSYTIGAPRGYILPADPGQAAASPVTVSDKAHITYSEKGTSDSTGYAKLHSAPVASANTHMSQTDNPTTDHIGDWTMDYNVGIQGGLGVQGQTNLHGETTIHDNTFMQGNASVQGNLEVQGMITSRSFTVTGMPFETTIESPKLACMSRFKEVAYSLRRSIDLTAKKFNYEIVMSGILELNIGVLSAFNANDCIFAPHQAISGYGPNWDSTGSYSGASTLDGNQTRAFGNTGCKQKSKLYNVVKYEIPFDLTKAVTSNALYSSVETRPNIFGYANVSNSVQWKNAPQTRGCFKNSRDGISLRFVSTGFNIRTFSSTGFITKGCDIKKTIDTDGVLASNINSTCTSLISDTTVTAAATKENITTINSDKGIIHCITDQADSQRNTSSNTENNYAIHGVINYAPYSLNIEYYFDLFTRIFETDYSSWKTYSNDADTYFCNNMDFNIFLNIVPVGFVCCKYGTPQREYHAPIWNAINVNNEGSKSIRSNIFALDNNMDILTTVFDSSSSFNPSTFIINGHTLFDISQSNSGETLYTTDNALISNKFSKAYSQETAGGVINGPQTVIMNGENVFSQYLLGVFDCPNTSTGTDRINCISFDLLGANYFDITPSLRMVENNIKICPNNLNMGTWESNSNGRAIAFKLAEPIPLSIIPYEGYIGSYQVSGGNEGKVKIGCCNFKSSSNANGEAVVFNGLLVYPFTPCIIMNPSNDQSINDSQNDAYTGGSHKISHGRMMGVTDGSISGMITMLNSSNTSNVPSDWSDYASQQSNSSTTNPDTSMDEDISATL